MRAHNKQMPNIAMSKPPFLAGQALVSLFFNLSQKNSPFPPNHQLTFLLQSFVSKLSHFFAVLVTENSGAVLGKDTMFANLRPASKALGSLLLKLLSKVKGEYS